MTDPLAGWGEMTAALVLFLAAHVVPARPKIRNWLKARLGLRAYIAVYSVVSAILLIWLVVAAGRAPHIELWPMAPWQYWAPLVAMPLACLLAAFGAAVPNPFSIGGLGNERFDPDRPGIAGVTRHPLLWAPTFWAFAHLFPNGDLAHVVLFGLMAGFGLIGMYALDRRRQREWGLTEWRRLAARTSFIPFLSRDMFNRETNLAPADWLRLAGAAVLYLALLHAHEPLIGFSPIPPM
jgi:uncharacterized membrane protein